ncbi:MAG TPA: thymidylate kinase [Acidobacteriota bacterium]|jgi:dTMP kinase|nr:thymidylate kinase [Acidobacteriota bacterium]HNT16283.1 thymidylate kinase [Acidobacteriota bacterium]HPA26447.1 thymidylate kinase [Acidobacteriota bacterium]HQO18823.1 thymidylate kinase [Acidobacteriota bacterium]HQQ47208.1 thymidylate kinase [Acidobacteriota bacterium]
MKKFFQEPLPGVAPASLRGKLIVIEGPDCSGRTTQIELVSKWLELKGYAVVQTGLKRSLLVAEELEAALQGNVLSPRTLSLFYATDFYDQLENTIIPALRAGLVVIADRYVYTLMARAIIRGAEPSWVEAIYRMAVVPDLVLSLQVSPKVLVERTFQAHYQLDYWESGMDMGLSRDWFTSFLKYQRKLRLELKKMEERYGFEVINAGRSARSVDRDLKAKIATILDGFSDSE